MESPDRLKLVNWSLKKRTETLYWGKDYLLIKYSEKPDFYVHKLSLETDVMPFSKVI